jgi:hypothetical protein
LGVAALMTESSVDLPAFGCPTRPHVGDELELELERERLGHPRQAAIRGGCGAPTSRTRCLPFPPLPPRATTKLSPFSSTSPITSPVS